MRSQDSVSAATRSVLFLIFDLRDSRLHQFFNKCGRQWLIRGELDGSFGCGEALKFLLERFDNGGSREQTTVVRKRGEPHQHSFVFDRRNPIADGLGGLRWHSRPNCCTNLVQGAAGGFRDTSKVFINAFRNALSLRRRTALGRFHFFHAGNATKTSTSSPCPIPTRSVCRVPPHIGRCSPVDFAFAALLILQPEFRASP